MKMRKLPIHSRGFTLVEISVSATLLGLIYWLALSGYVSSMKGSTTGEARLEALAENARALMTMNTELQEASVRDETVQIYQIDPDSGVMVASPVDPADVPPPGTVFPTTNSISDNDAASDARLMPCTDSSASRTSRTSRSTARRQVVMLVCRAALS